MEKAQEGGGKAKLQQANKQNFQHRYKGLYQISLLALMYVGLLAYSQVFADSIIAAVDCEVRGGGSESQKGLMGYEE